MTQEVTIRGPLAFGAFEFKVPGIAIFSVNGIESYRQPSPNVLILQSKTGEEIQFSKKTIKVLYGTQQPSNMNSSRVEFDMDKDINVKDLIEKIKKVGILPPATGALAGEDVEEETSVPVPPVQAPPVPVQYDEDGNEIVPVDVGETIDPTAEPPKGGKHRKTRMRKTKHRRTLRKHK